MPDSPHNAPASTYRLQFHGGFTFEDARRLVPYLARLGVTHCYSSPYLMARPGSTHGYDICDHTRFNPEIGSRGGVRPVRGRAARTRDGPDSRLRPEPHGHRSADQPLVARRARERAVLAVRPLLRHRLGAGEAGAAGARCCCRSSATSTASSSSAASCSWCSRTAPCTSTTSTTTCRSTRARRCASTSTSWPASTGTLGEEHAGPARVPEHHDLAPQPARRSTRPTRRGSPSDSARRRWPASGWPGSSPQSAADPASTSSAPSTFFNGTPGQPARLRPAARPARAAGLPALRLAVGVARDQLPPLLRHQRAGGAPHGGPRGLRRDARARRGADPQRRRCTACASITRTACSTPRATSSGCRDWSPEDGGRRSTCSPRRSSPRARRCPTDWPIAGTTGYTFATEATRLLVDPAGERPLRQFYARFTGLSSPFAEVVYESKKLITRSSLASELNVLAHALNRISESNRRSRDFTLESLRGVLQEVVACFPVYRTYIDRPGLDDRRTAIGSRRRCSRPAAQPRRSPARSSTSSARSSCPGAIRRRTGTARTGVTATRPDGRDDYERRLAFSMKLQQFTAPVQAKGVEDTAFYRYNLLVSLNEVGGEPSRVRRPTRRDARLQPGARRTVAPRDADHLDSRHEARRGRARAHHRALRDSGGVAPPGVPGGRASTRTSGRRSHGGRLPTATTSTASTRCSSASGPHRGRDAARPGAGRTDRPHEAVHDEGHQGGEGPHELGQRQPGVRSRRGPVRRRGPDWLDRRRSSWPRSYRSRRGSPASPWRTPSRRLVLKLASPGVPDFYQGTELWDLQPGGPRQPPPGRLRSAREDPG